MKWDDEVAQEVEKYRKRLTEFSSLIRDSKELRVIVDSVLVSAGNASLNAGYSGSHSDNGASSSVESLIAFLSGFNLATGGDAGKYQAVLDEHKKVNDPEYKQYLELKKKFENKK